MLKPILFSLIINCLNYIIVDAGGNGPCCPRRPWQSEFECNGVGKCNIGCCNCDIGCNSECNLV